MKRIQEGVKVKLMIGGGIIAIIAVILFGVFMQIREKAYIQNTNPELARAMEYEEVKEGDEAVEGTDYVEFDAFFLRDINQDGYAESIRGTCKPIGQDDTLYMELNVQTAGYLKNAKIDINGENFYLQTLLPKDDELKDNYIGNNIKTIEFNDIANGTQKMLTGIVRSGDYSQASKKAEAIGNNINNYSNVNSVTLTGTYVAEDGTETQITKTVDFNIDWYGETKATITTTNQNKDITNAIDEEKGELSLEFTVYTEETDKELIISKNHVEGEIPELNGYKPLRVEYTGSNGVFYYDTQTRIYTIERNAQTNEEGNITTSIARSNSYGMKVVYPIEAYQELGQESVQIRVPVKTYYEGYNNPNDGFTNPYKSNIAESTVVATYEKPAGKISRFEVIVGKYIYQPSSRYIVSKEKPLRIYNGISEESAEDTYNVQWRAYVGTDDVSSGIRMQETKDGEAQVTDNFIKNNSSKENTDDVISNVGIYFTGADGILGADGWIKIYDAETDELIHEFTANEWNKYTSNNPYKYEVPVKHIRVETSNVIEGERSLYVYNIKEIDDDKLTEKYTREDFDKLQYIESTLVGYRGEKYINSSTHRANYEAPISVANISIINNTISTQTTEENAIIRIMTETNTSYNEVNWQNGTFLVKLPKEIIDVQLNEVKVSSSLVNIESYELIENEEGTFIRIVTKNDTPTTYSIQIDADLTADPRKPTATRNIELYATNENGVDYYYSAKDKYDVNNNSNTEEQVNYRTSSISMVAPNTLITAETASNFDENGSEIISPEIADLKPVYAVVDQAKKEQTATIGVQIRNNYGNTISEISILGKIPFEGNTYVVSGKDLGSTFTTKMAEIGIEVPEELKQYVTVYYSENENPTKDISEQENGWKIAEQVANWDNVKTYLIDLGDFVMQAGDEYVFKYTVKIPNGLEFNQVAFSHHGVYFSLDTDQGKYKTETEPNRLGLRIAEKYDLELTKYQTERDIVIPGATYRVTDVETGESKTGITNAEGKITISNLYAEKEYEIQEIKSPDDYELNENIIRFIGHVDENGQLTVEKTEGTTKGDMTVTKQEGESYKVQVAVEDEVKARLRIIKKETGTDNVIPGVKFEIEEVDKSDIPTAPASLLTESNSTKSVVSSDKKTTVTTDSNGEIIISGLSVGQLYKLTEIKAEGYYVDVYLYFSIENNSGNYEINLNNDWNVTNQEITEENGIPTINLTIENEKIPTYDLQILKIKKTTESTLNEDEKIANAEADLTSPEVEYLEGAKFRLYKVTGDNTPNELVGEYTTDSAGKISIKGLYQEGSYYFEDEWGEYFDYRSQQYILKEVQAPSGYAKVQDIRFKVEYNYNNKKIELVEINEAGEEAESARYSVEGNTVQLVVEDSPTFKLIKKDGETKEILAGVKFAIYNIENGQEPARNSKGEIIGTKETINGAEYYVVETNNKGEITEDLPEGLYKAVEVEADDKYDISGNVYYFGIGESKELEKKVTLSDFRDIGADNYEVVNSTKLTNDGGMIIAGYISSEGLLIGDKEVEYLGAGGNHTGFVAKIDADGKTEWVQSIGNNLPSEVLNVSETTNGDFVVVGHARGNNIRVGDDYYLAGGSNYNTCAIIVRYASDGSVKYTDFINGEDGNVKGYRVSQTSDNGFIVGIRYRNTNIEVQGTYIENKGNEDGAIIKYTENGKVQWVKSFGGEGFDYLDSVIQTKDNGYVVVGDFSSTTMEIDKLSLTNDSESTSYTDAFIIKYDSSGNVNWARKLDGEYTETFLDAAITTDNKIIAVGVFNSNISIENKNIVNQNEDGLIAIYDENGNLEDIKSISGTGKETITTIGINNNDEIVIGGTFTSKRLELGNFELTGSTVETGMIIKYDSNFNPIFAKNTNGNGQDYICSVDINDYGDILAGGYFHSLSITIDNSKITNINPYKPDGFIIKYSEKEVIGTNTSFAYSIGGNSAEQILTVAETNDGGYVIGGNFYSSSITIGDYTLENKNQGYRNSDAFIVKYNPEGEVEWAESFGGNNNDTITSVAATADGGYIVGGTFYSNSIAIDNYLFLNEYTSYSNVMLIKYNSNNEIEWATSYDNNGGFPDEKITSIVATEDGGYVVGGTFQGKLKIGNFILDCGNDVKGFIAKYNRDNEVEYAIKTVAGISAMTVTKNGMYIIGESSQNSGYISKYNIDNQLEWTKYINGSLVEFNSITEIDNGDIIVGGRNDSSSDITVDDYILDTNENYGILLRFDSNGKVKWATSFDGGYDGVISVIKTKDDGYAIGVDGLKGDIGNFLLENNEVSNGTVIKFNNKNEIESAISINGRTDNDIVQLESIIEAKDNSYILVGYANDFIIGDQLVESIDGESGFIAKIYPDTNIPEVQELTVENTRKEYSITTNVKEINGVKGGSITGEDENPYETVKYGDSSINEIVMTPDNGYEIIGITVNGKEYPFKANTDGTYTMPAFTNVTENKHIEVTYALTSNKFTISKIDSKTKEPLSGVKFSIEKINEKSISNNIITTNNEGKAITQLEYGRYQITELETADGYKLLDNPIIIDFTRDGNNIVENNNDVNITVNEAGELEIENKETAKVIVHHYLKDKDGTYTTTKVAENEIIEQTDKEEYTTSPKLDLEKYELEKDENGAYVIPENSKGKFIQEETIEVNYYYVSKEIPLTVHYYIEGTEDSVPLANGGVAKDETYVGEEGEQYATNSINEDELNERYELVEMPANANGTYEYNEIVVTYYYRLKQSSLLIQKVGDNGEPVAGVTLKIVNKETLREWTYETDNNGKIELMLDNGQYEITEIKAPEEYKLLKNPISVDVELNKENQITIENEKYKEFDFNINKVDSSTGKKISGIKFKLTYTTQYGEQKTEEYVTDENGLAKIPSLYEGIQYQLQEIETIPGYSLDDQIYEFNVEYKDGEYILNTQNPDLKNIQISGNQINVDIENEPTFKLIKEGTKGERVAGAKFTVAYEENELALTDEYVDGILDANGNLIGEVENINGENLRVVTTDENGEIALSLLPGRYVVTEVQAPDGYEMPENELDRSQVIEIESAQVTEISKANELDFNEALNNLNFMFDSIQINTISTYHNGTVIYGVLFNDLTIPKTYTSNDEDIVLERGEGIDNGADGIILYIDYSGKVEAVKQIKSEKDTMNILLTGAENRSGEMIALGYYMNSVTISGDETESGEQLTISNPEANEEIPGVYLVTYNSSNKVKDLRDVTYLLELMMNGPMLITVADKYMLGGVSNNNKFTIPSEETADAKEITINLSGDNPVMLVLNRDGKVISAKEAVYMEINKYNVETEVPLTTGGILVGGYADDNVIFTEEETENGQEIALDNTANDGFIAKYNEEGKVSWASKIESENGYCRFVTAQEVSNGYIGIAYYNNDLKIQTVSGEELTFENQEGVVLIKYNAQGQIEWANDISDDMEMFDDMPYIIEQKNGYVLLDYNGSGNSILYNAPNGYTIPIEPVEITITNTTLETLNVPVAKVWDDESNKLGKRPESVIFKLTGSDGSVYTKELTVPGTEGSTTTKDSNNENKWNDIFENIPRFDAEGNWITYTLSEEEKTEGDLKYYDTIIDAKNNIITNTNKYGKVTVHYYIQNPDETLTTNRVPDTNGTEIQDIIIEGKEGDEYSTEPVENVSDKYELVEEKLPANAEGTLEKYNEEKPQEVIYYYRLKPAKVIINYLEKDGDLDDSNNAILSEQEQIDGYVDDKYNTDTDHRKETISYNGKTYTLVEDSQNTEGTMTVEDIKVTYYYLQNTKATVRYVERDPETHEIIRDLEEPRTEEGLVGDEFVTTEKAFTGYRLVEAPENKTIEMTKEEQTLIYYYEPITTGLVENHIDDITGKVLYTETHNVQVGQNYNIPNKEFAGYDLVETKLPNNSTGIMGEELVTVNYYYIKKAVLEVNYIDKATGEPLADQMVDETKHEGDSYTTVEKTFEGYELIEEPENANGTMEVEVDEDGNIVNNRTVVTYYYGKPAEIEEHHVDILTKEELEEPTIHKGYVGEEYNIPSKEFLSYVVAVDDGQGNNILPTNSTGKYTEEKQVVTYYYYQPAKVIVHYVDMTTGKELQETNEETGKLQSSQVIMEGSKDLVYTTTAKEFLYYTLVQSPEEPNGTMKVEITKDKDGKDIVNNTIDVYYYYEPKSFNIGVDKTISKITVNGEEQNISNNKLTRVEIYRKNVNDTKVEVEYTIKVTNNGEVDGKAIIREDIPDGMSVVNNDKTWDEKDGYLEKVIPEIKAGETKEYKITLSWDRGDANLGEKENTVEITQTDNIPGFKDNNDQDNSSEARVLINVSTGSVPWPLIVALIAVAGLETVTLSYARVLTNKQKKNRK